MKLFLKIILFLLFTYGFLYMALKYYSRKEANETRDFSYVYDNVRKIDIIGLSDFIYSYNSTRGTYIYFKDSTEMLYDEDNYMQPILLQPGIGYFDLSYHTQKADSIRKLFRASNVIAYDEVVKDSIYIFEIAVSDDYSQTLPKSISIDSFKVFHDMLVYSLDSNFYIRPESHSFGQYIKVDSLWYFIKGI